MNKTYHPNKFNHSDLAQRILDENDVLYDKIQRHCKVSRPEVLPLLTEVMRFLNLIAFLEEKLTPGKTMDDCWHEFILCTHTYWQFCTNTFGRMIHHYPGGTETENARQFKNTLKAYRLHFGEPPAAFWGHFVTQQPQANCGGCEAQ